MRFRLKTILIIVAVACAVLARSQYVKTRYPTLTANGATIYYEWQAPSIVEIKGFRWRKPTDYATLPTRHGGASSPFPTIYYRNHAVSVSTTDRSWVANMFYGSLVGDKPKIVELTDANLTAEQLQELKSMLDLESILHIKFSTALQDKVFAQPIGGPDEKIIGDFGRGEARVLLSNSLPGVKIFHQTTF